MPRCFLASFKKKLSLVVEEIKLELEKKEYSNINEEEIRKFAFSSIARFDELPGLRIKFLVSLGFF